MSLYTEDWDPEDYVMHGSIVTRKLTKNNLAAVDATMPGEFIDYAANKNIPCLPYYRATVACYNKHGFMTPAFFSSAECQTVQAWFGQCLNQQKFSALQRKYYPEARLDGGQLKPVLGVRDIL